ncbi:MAG: helix-turn-helix transcriptional regulator [Clostridiales bacterium]|nr:helix-turn-helix transcriptional regulator [Clostridiales bacterium]
MDLYKIVGHAIRHLRTQRALSQVTVSTRSGVNHSYYCAIERGDANPSVKKLYDILSAIGATPAEFAEALSIVVRGVCVTTDAGSLRE